MQGRLEGRGRAQPPEGCEKAPEGGELRGDGIHMRQARPPARPGPVGQFPEAGRPNAARSYKGRSSRDGPGARPLAPQRNTGEKPPGGAHARPGREVGRTRGGPAVPDLREGGPSDADAAGVSIKAVVSGRLQISGPAATPHPFRTAFPVNSGWVCRCVVRTQSCLSAAPQIPNGMQNRVVFAIRSPYWRPERPPKDGPALFS